MFNIFKQYGSYSSTYNNEWWPLVLNAIGGAWIGMAYIATGVICITFSNINKLYPRKRILVTKIFGWSLIACGFSRGIEVLCLWDNLAIFSGIIKNIVGGLQTFVLFYMPFVIREALSQNTINEVKSTLKETQRKIDTVQEMGDRIGAK